MADDRNETQDASFGKAQQDGQDNNQPRSETDASAPGGQGEGEGLYEDPVADLPGFHQTSSTIAIAGHPLHAMSVAFPIALTFCTFGADLFYWWTGDGFWARAALWAAGMAFLIGVAAAFTGTLELLFVPGIRARAAAWTHAGIAVVLLSILGTNWGYRLYGYEDAVLPYGILLSGFSVVMVGATGWHGGRLVFDYHLGTSDTGN
ncbi:DUF2231 domain-containing protein [Paracoccus benzoatiresistens]|uniref:DUF2231 domain-containing protein n=1 Tax=Paracoccus benzoatiresistens TaxID=2997341 RepID=UPI002E3143F9|nr:DUF2231 domain-containing protein [Paracoccus sp. EF6]